MRRSRIYTKCIVISKNLNIHSVITLNGKHYQGLEQSLITYYVCYNMRERNLDLKITYHKTSEILRNIAV